MSWESWKPWWAAHGSGHSAASHWGGQFLGTNLVRGWLGLRDRPGSREMQRCGWARCQGYQHQKKRIVSGRGRVGDGWWGLARSNGSDAAYPCFHVVIAQAIRIKGLIGRIWQNPAGRPSPSQDDPGRSRPPPLLTDERRSYSPGGGQSCDGRCGRGPVKSQDPTKDAGD